MKRDRFLIRALGDNIDATRAGLLNLIQLIAKDEHAVIVVPSFAQLKPSILNVALGEDLAKILIKQRTISFEDGKKVSICSAATLKNFKYANLYLALWCSGSVVAEIEALSLWRVLVMVSWLPAEGDAWAANKGARLILDTTDG